MKRLVYRPKIWAYVKAMEGGIPIDISPYIVKGNVERVVDDVSTAKITIRNPDFKFTEGPTFHPMDPITIFMARNINYPVRVFTGFLDDTPYLQLFPGSVTLTASCTLKRLKHTYWDPALPFTQYFLARYGWQQDVATGTMRNIDAENRSIQAKNVNGEIHTIGQVGLNDSGLSALISASMENIGHWDPKDLLVEPLPSTLTDDIDKLWTDLKDDRTATQEAFKAFLASAIGDPPQEVSGGAAADAASGSFAFDGTGTGPAAVEQAYAEAVSITNKRLPYVWGGGHSKCGSPSGGGYDCSGSVAAVLCAGGMGFREGQGVPASYDMAKSWGKAGKGRYLTMYANSSHVFLVFNLPGHSGHHFGTGEWGKGFGGAGFNPKDHPTSGFTARHWPGT